MFSPMSWRSKHGMSLKNTVKSPLKTLSPTSIVSWASSYSLYAHNPVADRHIARQSLGYLPLALYRRILVSFLWSLSPPTLPAPRPPSFARRRHIIRSRVLLGAGYTKMHLRRSTMWPSLRLWSLLRIRRAVLWSMERQGTPPSRTLYARWYPSAQWDFHPGKFDDAAGAGPVRYHQHHDVLTSLQLYQPTKSRNEDTSTACT